MNCKILLHTLVLLLLTQTVVTNEFDLEPVRNLFLYTSRHGINGPLVQRCTAKFNNVEQQFYKHALICKITIDTGIFSELRTKLDLIARTPRLLIDPVTVVAVLLRSLGRIANEIAKLASGRQYIECMEQEIINFSIDLAYKIGDFGDCLLSMPRPVV